MNTLTLTTSSTQHQRNPSCARRARAFGAIWARTVALTTANTVLWSALSGPISGAVVLAITFGLPLNGPNVLSLLSLIVQYAVISGAVIGAVLGLVLAAIIVFRYGLLQQSQVDGFARCLGRMGVVGALFFWVPMALSFIPQIFELARAYDVQGHVRIGAGATVYLVVSLFLVVVVGRKCGRNLAFAHVKRCQLVVE